MVSYSHVHTRPSRTRQAAPPRSTTRRFHRQCTSMHTSRLPLPRYRADQRRASAARGSRCAPGPCCSANSAAPAGKATASGSRRRSAVRRNPR